MHLPRDCKPPPALGRRLSVDHPSALQGPEGTSSLSTVGQAAFGSLGADVPAFADCSRISADLRTTSAMDSDHRGGSHQYRWKAFL